MTPRTVLASLLLGALHLAACDTTTRIDGADGVFATEGTDYPTAAVALASHEIVVGALAEGVIAPTDGTIGYPAVVRFADDDVEAVVYDDGDLDYTGVHGIAPLGTGLAIATATDREVTLYATDRRGRSRDVLFRPEVEAGLPEDALVATPDGLVLAVYPSRHGDPHLYAVSASGQLRWTYRVPDAQDVRAVSVGPDGDLYVVAVGDPTLAGRPIIERLSPDGEARWRVTRESASSNGSSYPMDLAATADGVVVVFREFSGPRFAEADGYFATVLRLDGAGEEVWARTVLEGGQEAMASGLRPSRVAVLPDGSVVVGASLDDGDFETGNEAVLVLLEPDGAERSRSLVGEGDGSTTQVQGLLSLPDGRLGVVLAVGPGRLGGYGGDNFDIEVMRVDPDRLGAK